MHCLIVSAVRLFSKNVCLVVLFSCRAGESSSFTMIILNLDTGHIYIPAEPMMARAIGQPEYNY